MKLLSIRLHPFGGTADRTCSLRDGINVLEGPNEFGKSTLCTALWHVLFTKTNLTPAALRNTMGRWYPKPAGDHVKVSLSFEANGRRWKLQKTWGVNHSSHLQEDGTAGLADPNSVQNKLSQLLCRNEATWQHVLFTGQAQLSKTVEQLRANAHHLDDVQSLLMGATAIPGDIPAERLIAHLSDRINNHFSRWDRQSNAPEGGRGIRNPWANRIGPVLSAFYKMEGIRSDLAKVQEYEVDLDRINAAINHLMSEIETDKIFVTIGRTLRDGLNQRSGLEEKERRLSNELQTLRQVMTAWPGADQIIEGKKSELKQVQSDLLSLEGELTAAKKRVAADQLRKGHERLMEAHKVWHSAAEQLRVAKIVDTELLAELKRIEPAIDSTRIKIAAQKLTARLTSKNTLTLAIQRGTETPETLTLNKIEPWEGQAEGKFSLELDQLTLSVESGTGNVTALFENLKSLQQRRTEILSTMNIESLAQAELSDREHRSFISTERAKKDLYQAALQGRTEEQWTADMAELAALPDTRSVEVIDAEKGRLLKRHVELEQQIRTETEKVTQWTREHISQDGLTDKILEKTAEYKSAQTDLATLPALPDGFHSVAQYLNQLREKEATYDSQNSELNNLKVKQAELSGAAPAHTAEDLRSEFEILEREFNRQQAIGQALLRIEAKLLDITATNNSDSPMACLAEIVSRHFQTLTGGKYQSVNMDGTAPETVHGTISLDASLLSQGTLGSLALATRLALSELYLEGMDGFLVLDDPFTDMDNTRLHAAAHAIGSFAKYRQVLLFTCHPDHAQELQEQAGASSVEISA